MASHGGWEELVGDETDVVAGTDLSQGQENAVDYDEACDVGGLGEMVVDTGHEESDGTL